MLRRPWQSALASGDLAYMAHVALLAPPIRQRFSSAVDPPLSHKTSTCSNSDKRRQSASRGNVIPARHSATSPSVTPSDFATRCDVSRERLMVISSLAANARPSRCPPLLSRLSLTWWSVSECAFMNAQCPRAGNGVRTGTLLEPRVMFVTLHSLERTKCFRAHITMKMQKCQAASSLFS